MSAIGSKLRALEGGRIAFRCPGCNDTHVIAIGAGAGPRWQFNGDGDRPTFAPSVLVRSGHYVPGHHPDSCWCTYNRDHPEDATPFACSVCHSFIRNGQIQFLNDCTHALAGKTVPLPDFAKGES